MRPPCCFARPALRTNQPLARRRRSKLNPARPTIREMSAVGSGTPDGVPDTSSKNGGALGPFELIVPALSLNSPSVTPGEACTHDITSPFGSGVPLTPIQYRVFAVKVGVALSVQLVPSPQENRTGAPAVSWLMNVASVVPVVVSGVPELSAYSMRLKSPSLPIPLITTEMSVKVPVIFEVNESNNEGLLDS